MNRPQGHRRRAAVGLVVAVWTLHQTLVDGVGHKAKVLWGRSRRARSAW